MTLFQNSAPRGFCIGADTDVRARRSLLWLQTDGLNQFCVQGDVFLDKRIKFARRHYHRVEAQSGQFIPHLWLSQSPDRLAVKLVHDLARRLCREEESEPRGILGIVEA